MIGAMLVSIIVMMMDKMIENVMDMMMVSTIVSKIGSMIEAIMDIVMENVIDVMIVRELDMMEVDW